MTTDTTERGLERLICVALTGSSCEPSGGSAQESEERPAIYGTGWSGRLPEDYDREYWSTARSWPSSCAPPSPMRRRLSI